MRPRPYFPLIAASAAALLTLAATLGPRAYAPTDEDGAGIRAMPTAVVHQVPVQHPADPLALGRELLIPLSERATAPEFSVQTASFGNGALFAAPAKDASATIVFFMAAWCWTCQPEAKALAAIHERYASQGVVVLTLDVDPNEGERELAAFRERTGQGGHLWAFDRGFNVARVLEVSRLDSTVVIDREGRIAYRDASPTDYEYLSAVVEALLAEHRT